MHKIDSPTKMRYVGNRVAACNASDPAAVPKSIADFIKLPGAAAPHASLRLPCPVAVQGVVRASALLCPSVWQGSLADGLH